MRPVRDEHIYCWQHVSKHRKREPAGIDVDPETAMIRTRALLRIMLNTPPIGKDSK